MTEKEKTETFAKAIHALIEGVEASGGLWLSYDEANQTCDAFVIGPGGLLDPRVADAYIFACQALNRTIVAEGAGGSDHFEADQVAEIVNLPRTR